MSCYFPPHSPLFIPPPAACHRVLKVAAGQLASGVASLRCSRGRGSEGRGSERGREKTKRGANQLTYNACEQSLKPPPPPPLSPPFPLSLPPASPPHLAPSLCPSQQLKLSRDAGAKVLAAGALEGAGRIHVRTR
eukprot:752819-Hanusia_phi.AAC.2